MNYAYVRVSSKEQKFDRQLDELKKYSIDKIFLEKESGKDFQRKEYRKLFRTLKNGDTLYICSLDRLGRNYEELLENWKLITQKKQANIIVIDMPILNTKSNIEGIDGKFISNLVLEILAYVSQKEREKIKERQAQGIKSAMDRGIKFGRPSVKLTDDQVKIINDCADGKYEIIEKAVIESGLSRATFYRNLKKLQTS